MGELSAQAPAALDEGTDERKRRAEAEAEARRLEAVLEACQRLLASDEPRLGEALLAVVPTLADACLLDLVDDDGALRRFPLSGDVAEGVSIERGPQLEALSMTSPLVRALESQAQAAELLGPSPEAVTGGREARAALLVPLRVSDRPAGVLTLLALSPRAGFTAGDRSVASSLGRALGSALAARRRTLPAKHAADARDHLISVVSHDLRNPLFNVQMASDELLATAPPQFHRHIEIVRRATKQMNRLIQDLLDVSRIESGKLTLEKGRFEPSSVVREAVALHGALATQRSIEVVNDAPEGLPRLLADRERIVQALGCLLHNAIKLSPERSRVVVRAESENGEVRMLVIDSGPGIAAERLPSLFERYAPSKRKERRGPGFGLTIARGLIEAHGGRIWVESRLGEGSTFGVALPLEPPSSASLSR